MSKGAKKGCTKAADKQYRQIDHAVAMSFFDRMNQIFPFKLIFSAPC